MAGAMTRSIPGTLACTAPGIRLGMIPGIIPIMVFTAGAGMVPRCGTGPIITPGVTGALTDGILTGHGQVGIDLSTVVITMLVTADGVTEVDVYHLPATAMAVCLSPWQEVDAMVSPQRAPAVTVADRMWALAGLDAMAMPAIAEAAT